MLAEKPEADEAWETELGIRDFVAREERRGVEFYFDQGARRRHDGLSVAFERGFITRKDLSIGFTYQTDWGRFYHEFRCGSTLDYQSRVEPARADDLILAAGMRLRRAEAELSDAQRILVRRVCGHGRVVRDALMAQLTYALRRLNLYYDDAWSAERAEIAAFAAPIEDLRSLGAVVRHRYEMGGGYIEIGAQDVLRVAQGGLCGICFKPIAPERGSLDHVVPSKITGRGLGATFRGPGNLLLTHLRCNQARGNSLPTSEQIRALKRANAILGWGHANDEDPEDQWQILTEGLSLLPMAPASKHYPVPDPGIKSLGMTAHEWARRKVALERTLKRLAKLNAEPPKEAVDHFARQA